jgi:hypothetical protein
MLEMQRILVVAITSTRAQVKELAPPVHRGEAQGGVAGARSPSMPPLLTTDGVDKM